MVAVDENEELFARMSGFLNRTCEQAKEPRRGQ
jgi:hypothetical protein